MIGNKLANCVIAAAALLLSSCALLPTDGPQAVTMLEGANTPGTKGFEVVEIEPATIKALRSVPPPSFVSLFGNGAPAPVQKIGIGDVVSVTIWEAAGGGLYTGSEGANAGVGSRSTTLPPQTIDRDGRIALPYGGQ